MLQAPTTVSREAHKRLRDNCYSSHVQRTRQPRCFSHVPKKQGAVPFGSYPRQFFYDSYPLKAINKRIERQRRAPAKITTRHHLSSFSILSFLCKFLSIVVGLELSQNLHRSRSNLM
ncbi:unnamed protein product [Linum trigynum]|uniref:Uncharacterized protein n=1 Tax=Linum trigynum TaxID=586398 RepID=A0AAV2D7I5_9ROSI